MQITAQRNVSPFREIRFDDGSHSRVTNYLGHLDDLSDGPQAFRVEYHPAPGGSIKAHFHHVRQFQVFVGGDGRVGKHSASPLTLHYTDADSPYGPIVPADGGITYLTLRPRGVKGSYYMPGSKAKMQRPAGRNLVVSVSEPDPELGSAHVPLIDVHPDGLAAWRVRLDAHEETVGPDPKQSGGQYYVVCAGAIRHDAAILDPYSLVWIDPDGAPPVLSAAGAGADVLVLQFPTSEGAEDAGRATEVDHHAADYHRASGIAEFRDTYDR